MRQKYHADPPPAAQCEHARRSSPTIDLDSPVYRLPPKGADRATHTGHGMPEEVWPLLHSVGMS